MIYMQGPEFTPSITSENYVAFSSIEPSLGQMYTELGLSTYFAGSEFNTTSDHEKVVGFKIFEKDIQVLLGRNIVTGRNAFFSALSEAGIQSDCFKTIYEERRCAHSVYQALLAIDAQSKFDLSESEIQSIPELISDADEHLNALNSAYNTNLTLYDFQKNKQDIISGVSAEKVLAHHFLRSVYSTINRFIISKSAESSFESSELFSKCEPAVIMRLLSCARAYNPDNGGNSDLFAFTTYLINSINGTLLHEYISHIKPPELTFDQFYLLGKLRKELALFGDNPIPSELMNIGEELYGKYRDYFPRGVDLPSYMNWLNEVNKALKSGQSLMHMIEVETEINNDDGDAKFMNEEAIALHNKYIDEFAGEEILKRVEEYLTLGNKFSRNDLDQMAKSILILYMYYGIYQPEEEVPGSIYQLNKVSGTRRALIGSRSMSFQDMSKIFGDTKQAVAKKFHFVNKQYQDYMLKIIRQNEDNREDDELLR